MATAGISRLPTNMWLARGSQWATSLYRQLELTSDYVFDMLAGQSACKQNMHDEHPQALR